MFKRSNLSTSKSVANLEVTYGRFGRVTYRDPRFDQRRECRDCHGNGTCPFSDHPCATCGGTGVIDTSAASTVSTGRGR